MVAAFVIAVLGVGVFALVWMRSHAPVVVPAQAPTAPQRDHTAEIVAAIGSMFDAELETTRQQLAERDAALEALEAQVASAGPQTRTAMMASARRRVATLAAALARDRAAVTALQQAPRPAAPPPDPEVVAARKAVDDARERLGVLEARLTPQHPDVLRQIDTVREREAAATTLAAARPRPVADPTEQTRELKALEERVVASEAAHARALRDAAAVEATTTPGDAAGAERDRLLREREVLQAIATALEVKRDFLRMKVKALPIDPAQDEAATEAAAAPPAPRLLPSTPWIGWGLGGALLFAVMVGFVLHARDTKIRDLVDLRAATDVPLLVSVNEIVPVRAAPATAERELSTLPEPATATLVWHPRCPRRTVEQYRRLAQGLRRIRAERQIRVVGITSALPGEGKTLSAVNLAVSLAEGYRQRVLLVDADLRRPAVQTLLSLPKQQGLADWLRRDDERECPVVRLNSRLSVVPAGTPSDDPLPLLTTLRMALFLATARTDFDWVVIDTPPTGLIADAGVLDANVDGFIVLAAAERTTGPVLRQAIASLGQDRILGVLFNRVRHSDGADSDSYSNYYAMPSAPQ